MSLYLPCGKLALWYRVQVQFLPQMEGAALPRGTGRASILAKSASFWAARISGRSPAVYGLKLVPVQSPLSSCEVARSWACPKRCGNLSRELSRSL